MIVLRHRLKRNWSWSFLALFALLISTLDMATYGFHWPWDQRHDATQPNVPPNPPPKSPPCDCDNATGSPVFLASGRYFYTVTDLRIPGQGLSLEVTRTYNSMDRHNGLFGYGWLFSLDTRLVPVSDGTPGFAIVRMPDGSRVPYRLVKTVSWPERLEALKKSSASGAKPLK